MEYNRSMRKRGIILGVGKVDVDYKTQVFDVVDGKRKLIWVCPYYEKWKQMIRRCYSNIEKKKNTGYEGVTCVEDWLSLSKFKEWMETQEFRSSDGTLLELDKDILYKGNKLYSPETCVFIHHKINSFIFREDFYSRKYPTGACELDDKYLSQCNDPFKVRPRKLGIFDTPEEAHEVWRQTKHKYACELADSEYVTDERVAEALRNRYT